MKKYFGEFLIEKKLLVPEALVEALVEQSRGLPSVSEVFYKKKLLESTEILRVLHYQEENRVDFVRACQELQLWKAEMEDIIDSEFRQSRELIGQILIRQGHLAASALVDALDEYLNDSDNRVDPLLEIAGEFKVIPPEILTELEFGLNAKLKAETLDLHRVAAESDGTKGNIAARLKFKIHLMRGWARLAQVSVLEFVLRRLEGLTPSLSGVGLELFGEGLLLAWEIRDAILRDGSEEKWVTDSEQKGKILRFLSSLEQFEKKKNRNQD